MSAPKPMEEKRKKFGMEMLPSLHKRLKQLAADREVPLWSLTQEAIMRWLGEIPNEKDEQKMTASTNSPTVVNEIGTFRLPEAPIDPKILSKDSEVQNVTENLSSEREPFEIPLTRADAARIEAKVDRLIESLAEGRAGVAGVASPLEIAKKTAGRTDRAKRVVPRRKRRHPPGAQSGA